MRKLTAFPVLVCLLCALTMNVNAKETGQLGVNITTSDNEKILMMTDHICYSSVPLVFTPDTQQEKSYSISVDDGESFGAYIKMDNESVTLYPDDKTAPNKRWLIRFKSMEGEDECFSDVYKVCFDVTPPDITLADPDKISGILTETETVSLQFSDDTGITRVISKCGSDIIGELHRSEGEEVTDCTLTLELKPTGRSVNTVETTCFDLAGNSSVMTFEYMYDDTAPSIHVEGVDNSEVCATPVSLSMTSDDGDDDAFISYVLKRETGDEIVTKEASDLVKKAVIDLDDDGLYTLSASAYDRAGNRSDEIVRRFRIDTTPPRVAINGAGEGADLRKGTNISFDVEDECEGTTEVNITMKRTAMGKTDLIPIETYKTQAVLDSREVNINSDGEYEITLAATDGAGNRSDITKRFRMDTNAPDISISGINEGGVTGSRPVIRFCAGEMFYDSTIMTSVLEKKEKDGYRFISKNEHVMKDVHDHVDVIADSEGVYRLTCSASDRSGNKKEDSITFTVDYTPPVISGLSDVDNSFFKSFKLAKKVREYVRDATAVKALAYINDVPFSDEDTIIQEGKYVLTIHAKDEADNESEDSAVFIVDHTSPQVVLEGFDKNGNIQKGSIVRVGLFDDADHLVSVKFGDMDVPIGADGTAQFPVNDYGSYCISVVAKDDAGNVTDTDIHTECYMNAFLSGGPVKEEKTILSSAAMGDDENIDPIGLMVGMLSILSGTFGFVYRTFLRD